MPNWTPQNRGDFQPDVVEWFEACVRADLINWQATAENERWFRHGLEIPRVFEWTVDWFLDRIQKFVLPTPRSYFDPGFVDHANLNRLLYCHERVAESVYNVVEQAIKAITEEQRVREELTRFPTIEDWLHALNTGHLPSKPPQESYGGLHVHDAGSFQDSARRRRRTWPRVCRSCWGEFQADRGNVRNCPDCRAKRRGAPR